MIIRATTADANLLSRLGTETFLDAHGHSAPASDIENYTRNRFGEAATGAELANPANLFYIIHHENQPAGYSKLLLDTPHPGMPDTRLSKLERIYLRKAYYQSGLGKALLRFNIELSRQNGQEGLWLFVWIENKRAVQFYQRNGFIISGSYDFPISATHSNPNHIMLLRY